MNAWLRLLRPANGAMAAVAVLVGLALMQPQGSWTLAWAAAPLAAFLITGFGNVLNDIVDRELDRTAHPGRPLPRGEMGLREAQAFAVLLLAAGLLAAYFARGPPTLLFATANAALLGLYEARLKRLPLAGNLAVAVLVASAFPFGALAVGTIGPAVWTLAVMAFLATAARELWKDLEDIEADRAHRRTLPHVARAGTVHALVALLIVAAVALSVLHVLRAPWGRGGLALLAAADAGFLIALWVGRGRPGQGQRLLKAAMVMALAAFLIEAG